MTADEALRDYTLSVEGDVFASISEVFTCPACGGSGHRESPNGIDDPRCCQCGGGGMVRVISTHYLEWLREQVAQCDEVCKPDRAIAARAREELALLEHEASRHYNAYALVRYILTGEEGVG